MRKDGIAELAQDRMCDDHLVAAFSAKPDGTAAPPPVMSTAPVGNGGGLEQPVGQVFRAADKPCRVDVLLEYDAFPTAERRR